MTKSNYRSLYAEEIEQLKSQGCVAHDWLQILINTNTQIKYIQSVTFSGTVKIGIFERSFTLPGGAILHSGIYNSLLHDVSIGDDCYISFVLHGISNYNVSNDCFISNVDMVAVVGLSSFGNMTEVACLDETGGRTVAINTELSSQLAYIKAMYRYRPALTSSLNDLSVEYTKRVASTRGCIGPNVRIVRTGRITDVNIGDSADISGTARLHNGTIVSSSKAPVHIGDGVVCDSFIIHSGSFLDENTILTRCFVGQACELRRNYVATDSLFFANSQGENGEACSVFSGPYTVTHHKSTLLIAGMFSFMNAGSGSNQSNHMYKLGPVHQGFLERGCKLSSDSYVMWPSYVAAFSLVMGRHINHSDSSKFPFSYLLSEDKQTVLVPGVNLRSISVFRDTLKWRKRDHRTDDRLMDQINFELFSPFTAQGMEKGINKLQKLLDTSGEESDWFSYKGCRISNRGLVRGIKYYKIGLDIYMGNALLDRLERCGEILMTSLQDCLKQDSDKGTGKWVDISGMFAPKRIVEELLVSIEKGEIKSLEEINKSFANIHYHYEDYAWNWTVELIYRFYKINPQNMTIDFVKQIITNWLESSIKLDKMMLEDAFKEFNKTSQVGFGIDGNKEEKALDFSVVRGNYHDHELVEELRVGMIHKRRRCEEMLQRLSIL